MLKIIYEDNHLLVVEKPINMPVQADSSGDMDLLTEAKYYIKEKYNKPGDVYLGLVHRLDRPVGGVMVFARTSKAAARLTEAIKARRIKKRYAAVVASPVASYGTLENYIVKDESTHSSRLTSKDEPGAQRASLDYVAVMSKNGFTLVDVDLHTGRHHQIRAQFAGANMPLWGDQRYNPAAERGQQIALYAYSLTIEHPTLKESMTFTSIPMFGAFAPFGDALAALTSGVRCPYIDDGIIAVNKTAGISCAIADGGEDTLEARLRAAFGEVYPVHRLDVPTSGLVLFARTIHVRDALLKLIAGRELKKTYSLIVFSKPERPSGEAVFHAEKDSSEARVRLFDRPGANTFEMRTRYTLKKSVRLESGETVSLVEAELITGRTHQIRASFERLGCPIVGDDKYGDRAKNRAFMDRLMLCAVRIEFDDELPTPLKRYSGKAFEIAPPFELTKKGIVVYRT